MVASTKSMRCYANTASSGGGDMVVRSRFSHFVQSHFSGVSEQLADVLIRVFISEVIIKHLIVVELLCSISSEGCVVLVK
ncbi:unnamed protein product [Linum trigynum]|uniref:Uncharacterized protein n=1 Tax=Linum trigynum TaxID=586398 RepID=A0AAV2E6Y0_9ROSI